MARVLFLFCMAFTFAANADWLYWTTKGTQLSAINGCGVINYDAASIWVTKEGQPAARLASYLYTGYGWTDSPTEYIAADGQKFGMEGAVDISEYKTGGYSFYIEFYNFEASSGTGPDPVAGMSKAETYESLYEAGYIGKDLDFVPVTDVWLGSGYMVPEPTGGVLMLLGLGLLGLRRRRNREVA